MSLSVPRDNQVPPLGLPQVEVAEADEVAQPEPQHNPVKRSRFLPQILTSSLPMPNLARKIWLKKLLLVLRLAIIQLHPQPSLMSQ